MSEDTRPDLFIIESLKFEDEQEGMLERAGCCET